MANFTQNWSLANLASFWLKYYWPLSSPDFSLAIWCEMKRNGCLTPHSGVDSLKATVTLEWDTMSKEYSIRVCKTVEAIGDHN